MLNTTVDLWIVNMTSINRRYYTADLNFDSVGGWNKKGRLTTHFLNGLSALFPPGERFFIDAVMHFREDLKSNPELLADALGFVGQEVTHGRMHDQYDQALVMGGYPADTAEKITTVALQYLRKNLSPKMQLALTVAAEHYTATMANYLLDTGVVSKADPSYQWLWRAHAVEEIEHRSVSFDVYDYVYGNEYRTRMFAYFLTSVVLFPVFFVIQFLYALHDKRMPMLKPKEWLAFGKVIAGLAAHIGPELVEFLRPDYHPTQMKVSDKFESVKASLNFA